jgi:hypothetical protein
MLGTGESGSRRSHRKNQHFSFKDYKSNNTIVQVNSFIVIGLVLEHKENRLERFARAIV